MDDTSSRSAGEHAVHADSPPLPGPDRVRRFRPVPKWKTVSEGADRQVVHVLDGLAGARRLLARRRLGHAAIDDAIERELHGA